MWVNAFRLLYVHCRREKAEVAAESAAGRGPISTGR